MTVERKLKEMICEKYGSVIEFSRKIDIANSTLNSILNRGLHKASISNIIKICTELNISADELANDRIVPNENRSVEFNDANVEKIVEFVKLNISTYDLKLDNESMTNAEKQCFVDSLELTVEFIRRSRERKEVKI